MHAAGRVPGVRRLTLSLETAPLKPAWGGGRPREFGRMREQGQLGDMDGGLA